MSLFLTNSVRFREGKVSFNDQEIYNSSDSIKPFIKGLYTTLAFDYPKIHKMDNLSKLGVLAFQAIHSNIELEKYSEDKRAVLLMNTSGSLDIDCKHQDSIQDPDCFYPSPANFVYTLPNICLGEMAILKKYKGENNVYIDSEFDADMLLNQIKFLFETNKVDLCIAGWLEYYNEEYKVFLFSVERQGNIELETKELDRLWKL